MIKRYTHPEMEKIWSEENKFQKWLDVELAVCKAYVQLKKIPAKIFQNIQKKATFSIVQIEKIEKKVDHDVIAFLSSVAQHVGKDSRFIHMGMTSSDVVDTASALLLKEAAKLIGRDLQDVINSLRRLAKKHKKTVMMGRTHGVHAEPITFGLKLALFYLEMQRNLERMERAIENISVCKISGAVGTYSNISPKVEELVAKYLDLQPAPVSNQIIQRDRHAEYLTTLAIIAGTLEKLATEIRSLQRTELREVEEPFKKGQKGSSAMPHKKNPITCERICGLARLIRGNAMVALENMNLWHERDISHSSAERVIFPDSTILIDYMLKKMKIILDGLVVYPENMRKNIDKTKGLIFSQRLLMMLMDKKLTRDEAYSLVQKAAMKARDMDKDLKIVVMTDPKLSKLLKLKEIEAAFHIGYYLKNIDHIYKRIGL